MDIEQLKLILETIKAAGQGAQTFALLWLLKGFITTVISWTGAVLIFLIVAKLIKWSINITSFACDIANIIGVPTERVIYGTRLNNAIIDLIGKNRDTLKVLK